MVVKGPFPVGQTTSDGVTSDGRDALARPDVARLRCQPISAERALRRRAQNDGPERGSTRSDRRTGVGLLSQRGTVCRKARRAALNCSGASMLQTCPVSSRTTSVESAIAS
jgi:hypothetical protein